MFEHIKILINNNPLYLDTQNYPYMTFHCVWTYKNINKWQPLCSDTQKYSYVTLRCFWTYTNINKWQSVVFGLARTKESRTRLQRHINDRINCVLFYLIKSVCLSEVCGKSGGKIFQVKMQTCKRNNLNPMNCFKFELQLKF